MAFKEELHDAFATTLSARLRPQVIQRGNNGEPCFHDNADYNAYLRFLKDAADQYKVTVYAFVLRTNPVHLLVTPVDETGVSRMMKAHGRTYVQYFSGDRKSASFRESRNQ